MALFDSDPVEREAVRLGRVHEVPAEIHYSSGSDRWWYHGPLWVQETRPVHEWEFSPALRDPRNRFVLRLIKKGWTNERIATELVSEVQRTEPLTPEEERAALASATAVVREVRRAAGRAHEPHVLRIYGLKNASKTDERILVTIDQDLVHEAPMVPFTRTEKGSRRLQFAMMAAMAIIDAIFLYAMVSFVNAGPELAVNAGQIQQLSLSFGQLIALPSVILVTYVLMARRTLVLDLEIQPVVEDLQDTHSEAVYLVNSEKTPASTYLSRTFRLDPATVRGFTEEIARFQSDTIANLQEQSRSLRTELDSAKVLGVEAWSQSTDLKIARARPRAVDPARPRRDVGARGGGRGRGRRRGLGGDGGGGMTMVGGPFAGIRPPSGPDQPPAGPSRGPGSGPLLVLGQLRGPVPPSRPRNAHRGGVGLRRPGLRPRRARRPDREPLGDASSVAGP